MREEERVLREAAAWLAAPEHWTQGAMATVGDDDEVVATCLLGAINQAASLRFQGAHRRAIQRVTRIIDQQFPADTWRTIRASTTRPAPHTPTC